MSLHSVQQFLAESCARASISRKNDYMRKLSLNNDNIDRWQDPDNHDYVMNQVKNHAQVMDGRLSTALFVRHAYNRD